MWKMFMLIVKREWSKKFSCKILSIIKLSTFLRKKNHIPGDNNGNFTPIGGWYWMAKSRIGSNWVEIGCIIYQIPPVPSPSSGWKFFVMISQGTFTIQKQFIPRLTFTVGWNLLKTVECCCVLFIIPRFFFINRGLIIFQCHTYQD